MTVTVHLVFPPADDDDISTGLRQITEAIENACPDVDGAYGLGGEFGYGAPWDSDVFEMRRYNWSECNCEYAADWGPEECLRGHSNQCNIGAPNFRHKASGFEVRWYKYIGRDNEFVGSCDWKSVLAECLEDVRAKASEVKNDTAE